jgi:hypothetical protein
MSDHPLNTLMPVWSPLTTFLSCEDSSGAFVTDDEGRIVLCLACATHLRDVVLVAEPRPAPADSWCAACGRLTWGSFGRLPAPAAPIGAALLSPEALAGLGLTLEPAAGRLTPLELAEGLSDAWDDHEREVVDLLAYGAGQYDTRRIERAQRVLAAIWVARSLALHLDRLLAEPAPDLLCRLRTVIAEVRAGYGPAGPDDGPYAAEAHELDALLAAAAATA